MAARHKTTSFSAKKHALSLAEGSVQSSPEAVEGKAAELLV
jgi:hypothetical protein